MDTFFAATAPGLEAVTAGELRRLGLALPADRPAQTARRAKDRPAAEDRWVVPGGVIFSGELEALHSANLWLRSASRVLLRLGDFQATAFPELRKKAARLAWERALAPGQPVSLHVTCHKSRLYHSDAVAERIAGAIADRLGQPAPLLKAEDDPLSPPQLVVVRLAHDHCTISLDSSGALLHRRGYRQALAKAPLRETLAAAMLLACGWQTNAPLLDPFCGSGTIAIEAALLALGIPPGAGRRFAFMDWPGFDARRWQRRLEAFSIPACNDLPPILGSDRDAGAVEMAQANAERAGVAGCIQFSRRAVSELQPPSGPGWVVTNPPYGVRLSANQDLRNLYARLGDVLRQRCPGWQAAILCSDPALLRQTGLELDNCLSTVNGGINVRLSAGKIPLDINVTS